MDAPLLRTPPLIADESLLGYLLRVTEANGYSSISWLAQLAGPHSTLYWREVFVLDGTADLMPLSRLTGVASDTLAALRYVMVQGKRSNADHLIRGFKLPVWMLGINRPKICPDCLRESPHLRIAWDLVAITACSVHHRLLLDKCPACHKKLTWWRKKVCFCACGHDLRDILDEKIIDEVELLASRRIMQLFEQSALPCSVTADELLNADSHLFSLELRPLLLCLFSMAGVLVGIHDSKGKRLVPPRRNAELHLLLAKAYQIFRDWPKNFHSFLDSHPTPTKEAFSSVRNKLVKLRNFLNKCDWMKEVDFLCKELDQYLLLRGFISEINPWATITTEAASRRKYVSRTAALDMLRVCEKRYAAFVECGKIKEIKVVKRYYTEHLIERKNVLAISRELKALVTPSEDVAAVGSSKNLLLFRCLG